MQAQPGVLSRTQPGTSKPIELILVVSLYLIAHAIWIVGLFSFDHDFPVAAYFVTIGSAVLGMVALAGLWQGQRWGWWATFILCIVNVLLTLPEVAVLPGLMRAVSIVNLLMLAAAAVLLFRPVLRRNEGRK